MRVVVIASSETAGGAEQYLVRLYRGLNKQFGVEPILVGSIPGWDLGLTIDVGASPKLTRRRKMGVQALETAVYFRRVMAALRDIEADVVHVQFVREKILFPRILSHKYRVVWTEHGPLPTNFPRGAVPLLRWQSTASSNIAISDSVWHSMADASIGAEIIRNPLPSDEDFAPDNTEQSNTLGQQYFLYVGRLHRHKRVDLILRAAERLPSERFVIAGDGPERLALQREAPENVVFLGHVRVSRQIYEHAALLIIPSGREAREGLPLALLEARALGCPVVMASDCHATRDAEFLGARTFSPVVEGLVAELARAKTSQADDSISDCVAASMSYSAWLGSHYEMLSGMSNSTRWRP